ncbi:MAG: hypothetical protein ACK4UN_04795, partial [Limisphaerales bacterium]
MSIIRHQALFEREILRDGSTRMFRRYGKFEKVLVIAEGTMAETIKSALEHEMFDVYVHQTAAPVLKTILDQPIKLVIFAIHL